MTPYFYSAFKMALEAETESSLFSADQFGGYAVTALFTIINLLAAFIVIKTFVFKPIMKAMHKREELINSRIDEAEKSKVEAKNNAEESRKAIDDARVEAAGIVEASKENAEKQASIIIETAKNDASEIIKRAEEDSKRMKKAALEDMKDELSDLAVIIAGKIIGDALSTDKLKAIADEQAEAVIKDEVNKLG